MNDSDASTRRDFLRGRSAAAALRRVVDDSRLDVEAAPLPDPAVDRSYLLQLSRAAMACQFTIYLNAGQYADANERAIEALDLVDQLEDQLSVYRPHSELSHLNDQAGQGPVTVEAGLFELVQLSLQIGRDCDGAFDITTGPLSKAWGFFRREGRLPSEDEIAAALDRTGAGHVRLDADRGSIELDRPDIEINVNGVGKGYALDRAAAQLRLAGVSDFLMHGGQSSVYAAGSHAERPGRGWSIGLLHPLRPHRRLAEFYLVDRALGTSGAGPQFFHFGGKRFGHVIDPRSGWPAEGVFSATAIAPSAALADALSTAFYALGPDGAARYCAAHPDVSAVVVTPGKREGTIELSAFGLEKDDWSDLTA
jgi:thiamine biosynthesis lipoprotein